MLAETGGCWEKIPNWDAHSRGRLCHTSIDVLDGVGRGGRISLAGEKRKKLPELAKVRMGKPALVVEIAIIWKKPATIFLVDSATYEKRFPQDVREPHGNDTE